MAWVRGPCGGGRAPSQPRVASICKMLLPQHGHQLTQPPTGCGWVLLGGSGFKSRLATRQLCADGAAGSPRSERLLQPLGDLSLRAVLLSSARPSFGSSSSAELGMPQAWLHGGCAGHPIIALPASLLMEEGTGEIWPGRKARAFAHSVPLPTMLFQADFSLLPARPLAPI